MLGRYTTSPGAREFYHSGRLRQRFSAAWAHGRQVPPGKGSRTGWEMRRFIVYSANPIRLRKASASASAAKTGSASCRRQRQGSVASR